MHIHTPGYWLLFSMNINIPPFAGAGAGAGAGAAARFSSKDDTPSPKSNPTHFHVRRVTQATQKARAPRERSFLIANKG